MWNPVGAAASPSIAASSSSGHCRVQLRFISALTRGGAGGHPRPIEVHAHDPLRYVGDMLGWLHQISDLLGRETALSNTLLALKDAAQETFMDILKARGEKLLRYPPLVAVDLSPPQALREGVSVLLEIIGTYDGMMVTTSGKKLAFEPVISALLDPIIQTKEHSLIRCPELNGNHDNEIEKQFKILLAFSGLEQALVTNPSYNSRVPECRAAAKIMLQ